MSFIDLPNFPENGRTVLAELEACRDLFIAKTQDYGADGDAFPAFRDAERWGIPAWKSAAARMGNKYVRAQNLIGRDAAPAVADESIDDTLRDLAIYALITLALRKEAGL